MLFNLNRHRVIRPYESKKINFWADKWGIRAEQINEAIIQTGSIRVKVIKHYLVKKGVVFSIFQITNSIKSGLKGLAEKFRGEDDYC